MANLVLLPVWLAVQESSKWREDKTNVQVRKDLQRKGKAFLSSDPGNTGGRWDQQRLPIWISANEHQQGAPESLTPEHLCVPQLHVCWDAKDTPMCTSNTAVQMKDGAGLRELPPAQALDVPAKDTPALAILPLFLTCFAQHLLPLPSPFTAQCGLCVPKGTRSHAHAMSCSERQGKGRLFQGLFPPLSFRLALHPYCCRSCLPAPSENQSGNNGGLC